MSTELLIRDFNRTEGLENYLLTRIEDHISTFLKLDKDYRLKVKVCEDSHRQQNRKPHFICEVILKLKSSKQVLKVTKSGYDFYKCVSDTGVALKKILERRHAKEVTRRTRRQTSNFQSSPEPSDEAVA